MTTERSRIFISYRREDSEQAALHLAEDLRRRFAPQQVFHDIASIDPGADFVDALQAGLDNCAVVIVVIGPGWLSAKDIRGRRRLDLPDDWVRREVVESLSCKDVRVFPVLVGNADMPSADDLPEALRPLARRQAFTFTTRHWAKDVDELVVHLRQVSGLDQAYLAPGRQKENSSRLAAAAVNAEGGKRSVASLKLPMGIAAMVGLLLLIVISNLQRLESPLQTPFIEPSASTARDPAATTRLLLPPAPNVGEAFRDCDQCPEMIAIPAGSFAMGSPESEEGRQTNEGPQHRVTIARPFAIGKYEVTFEQWDACVSAGGCGHQPADEGWGRGRRPVINVSWEDARAYAQWLSKQMGKSYRLLSEAEWEYAARAGTSTRYPWGDVPGTNTENFRSSSQWGGKQTALVGSFTANRFGLHDMVGNVVEWTQDCRNDSYAGAPKDGGAWETGRCDARVTRGGSWLSAPEFARVAFRLGVDSVYRNNFVGFRLARTL